MENRIKEQQLDLFADRTSAATRRANQLRLYWGLFAAALLEVLQQRGLAGAVRDGQSAPEPVPVDADMATRGDS